MKNSRNLKIMKTGMVELDNPEGQIPISNWASLKHTILKRKCDINRELGFVFYSQ